jgi:hypothetical protein
VQFFKKQNSKTKSSSQNNGSAMFSLPESSTIQKTSLLQVLLYLCVLEVVLTLNLITVCYLF